MWGDATAWLALADANGMNDPFFSAAAGTTGIVTLTVPDYDSSYSGSAPQQ